MIATMREAATVRNLPLKSAHVGVVGAAGSVGSGISVVCASLELASLTLFDKRDLSAILSRTAANSRCPVKAGLMEKDSKNIDIFLATTNSPDFLFSAEARSIACREAELFADDHQSFALKEALLLPVLYHDPEEITHYRSHLAAELEALHAGLKLDTPDARRQALDAIADQTIFYLPYEGLDVTKLQRRYGQLVSRVMASNYPQWTQPLVMPLYHPAGKSVSDTCLMFFGGTPFQNCLWVGWWSMIEADSRYLRTTSEMRSARPPARRIGWLTIFTGFPWTWRAPAG